MDEYCEENVKCYAEENFFADLLEQYQRARPWLKGGQGYLVWGVAEGLM